MAIEESKDFSSLALDELIQNLNVHEVVMEKDSEIYRGKKERVKYISLKAKKESSDDETLTFRSDDKEYAMVDEKKGKSNRKFFRCGDPNHLIGDCPKLPRNKDQKAFIGGSWSDSENEVEDKTNDETCLMAQLSNKVTRNSSHYSDNASSLDNDSMQLEYDNLCEISLKIINNNKALKTKTDLLEKEILEINKKNKKLEKSKEIDITYGSTIKAHRSTIPGSVDPSSGEKAVEHVFSSPMSSRSDFVIPRKKLIHNKIEESKKPSLKPSLKSSLGYVKTESSPHPTKLSPLVDDDFAEEEAIRKNTKLVNNNNEEDESIEVDEIVNIKESKNHLLDQVIRKLNQISLRSQAQSHSNFFCFMSTMEPKNINEGLKDESWIVAIKEELNQFVANDVWELVPLPISQSVIGTKWVFKNKLDENGIVSRNKAKLVAQGYNQQEGIDYDETYALVARLESIRILLAIACANDFKLYQMDVKSAFLNGFINEEVYVAQPLGFIDFQKPNYAYKLKKALYGLKPAPKAWYDRLKTFLIKHKYSIGMVKNILFTKKSKSHLIIVQIYVDDIIFGSTSLNLCDDFAKIMHDEFKMSMIGELNFFLGLQIKQMEDGIFFNQSKYIKKMLKKFGLKDSKPTKMPMSTEIKLTKDDEANFVDSSKYRGMIGSLLYLTASRPNIVFSVCLCARFQENPKTTHLETVKHIFRAISLLYDRRSNYGLLSGIRHVNKHYRMKQALAHRLQHTLDDVSVSCAK
ncbi:retrovirus-related pol polyprotein from transposon TNT 1-94 [Tanacetum coccineum]|uniref:Retrovirus-related pol polyprotein from transposon TNT 1-94 n=1 Tax=Tanacetum coccineum TaxID=301880 RepID=A0ABQ5BS60_9ASTR